MRHKEFGFLTNAEISHKLVDRLCGMESSAEKLLDQAVRAKGLSLRTYHKLKKLARTIADLEQSELIRDHHMGEAIALRVNEKLLFS